MPITSFERKFIESIFKTGEFHVTSDDVTSDAVISAIVVKNVLIGLPFDDSTLDDNRPKLCRFTLKNARISGLLDLTDLNTPDLPITFENCSFAHKALPKDQKDGIELSPSIDMSGARCGRLSFKGCQFVEFKGHSLACTGPVDFSEVKSTETDDTTFTGCTINKKKQPRCEIDLRDAQIGGVFCAANTKLAVREKSEGTQISNVEYKPYALRLSGCKICGDIIMMPGFLAMGGIKLSRSNIEGNIWLNGAHLHHVWDDFAISLDGAHIRNSLLICTAYEGSEFTPFIIKGTASLYGTTVEGEIYCSGGKLEAPDRSQQPNTKSYALLIYQANIAKHIRLQADVNNSGEKILFECVGSIDIVDSHVGKLAIVAANSDQTEKFEPKENSKNTPSLSIDLSSSTFDNDVWIDADDHDQKLLVKSLKALQANFGGKITLTNISAEEIDLTSTHVKGDVTLNSVKVVNPNQHGAFNLSGMHIDGTCELQEITTQTPLNVNQAQISRNLIINHVSSRGIDCGSSLVKGNAVFSNVIMNDEYSAFNLSGMQIDGNCELREIITQASLNADQAQIGRDLIVDHVTFKKNHFTTLQAFSLRNVNIAGGLRLEHDYSVQRDPIITNAAKLTYIVPSFYPEWQLINVSKTGEKGDMCVSFLWNESECTNGNAIVLLDGKSYPIHELNRQQDVLNLNEQTVKDYLKFFSAYIWGEYGSFRIVTDKNELQKASVQTHTSSEKRDAPQNADDLEKYLNLELEKKENKFIIKAIVAYSNMLSTCTFEIQSNGVVKMINDEPIINHDNQDYCYNSPYWKSPNNSIVFPDGQWREMPKSTVQKFIQIYEGTFVVDLTAAKIGWLNDSYGKVFSNIALNLSAFLPRQLDFEPIQYNVNYPNDVPTVSKRHGSEKELSWQFPNSGIQQQDQQNRLPEGSSKDKDGHKRAQRRIEWIKRGWVYDSNKQRYRPAKTLDEFDAHPYQQVIEIYSQAGRVCDVADVLYEMKNVEWRLWAQTHREWPHFKRLLSEKKDFFWWSSVACYIVAIYGWWWSGSAWALLLFGLMTNLSLIFIPTLSPTLVRWLFKWCYGYGLKLGRATLTVCICIFLGWPAVEYANRGKLSIQFDQIGLPPFTIKDFSKTTTHQVLILDQTPVQTHVVHNDNKNKAAALMAKPASYLHYWGGADEKEIPCGDEINGFIYALDVFLPLVDLHEEEQCRLSGEDWAAPWHWAKAAYTLLGWLVISLFIITATGFIRRVSENQK